MGRASRRRAERRTARGGGTDTATATGLWPLACCPGTGGALPRCATCGKELAFALEGCPPPGCLGCAQLRAGSATWRPDSDERAALWPSCGGCRDALAREVAMLLGHARALARQAGEHAALAWGELALAAIELPVVVLEADGAVFAADGAAPGDGQEEVDEDELVERWANLLCEAWGALARRSRRELQRLFDAVRPGLARAARTRSSETREAALSVSSALSAALAAVARDEPLARAHGEAALLGALHAVASGEHPGEPGPPRPDLLWGALHEVAAERGLSL